MLLTMSPARKVDSLGVLVNRGCWKPLEIYIDLPEEAPVMARLHTTEIFFRLFSSIINLKI